AVSAHLVVGGRGTVLHSPADRSLFARGVAAGMVVAMHRSGMCRFVRPGHQGDPGKFGNFILSADAAGMGASVWLCAGLVPGMGSCRAALGTRGHQLGWSGCDWNCGRTI